MNKDKPPLTIHTDLNVLTYRGVKNQLHHALINCLTHLARVKVRMLQLYLHVLARREVIHGEGCRPATPLTHFTFHNLND